ncbi:MAG: response regulator [Candidatus Flexifilum sp.]|jgi:DNA-binding NarL/FixJ family response regulator
MTTELELPTVSPIRIAIVDDHQFFREGLRKYIELEDDMLVVAECDNGIDALSVVRAEIPDIVLLDVNLPNLNGLQITRMVKADYPQVGIIVLTAYHDSEQVLHTMRSGAAAYCPKDITPERLIEIIREVHAGYYVVGDERMTRETLQSWINALLQAYAGPYTVDPEEHFIPLSPREMEILQFVTHGMSNKEIAHQLSISQQTVKNHMTSILKKLNVQDRTQAAVTALKRGWVRLQDGLSDTTL